MVVNEKQKTPMYQCHVDLGAKIVEFGNWYMPISYEGTLKEHDWVRNQCGIFDVSHMGEIRIKGPDATSFVQNVTINDASKLRSSQGQYSAILNDNGGIIDDVIIYRIEANEYFFCVNATNKDIDYSWLEEKATGFDVTVIDESAQWSQIAVQGPKSPSILQEVLGSSIQLDSLEFMEIFSGQVENELTYIARTGYTGERGYEIYVPTNASQRLWEKLVRHPGIKPIGLGARDTLRLEASYLLHGNDIDGTINPLEAGIGWAVKFSAKEFVGKNALQQKKEQGLQRKLVAFLMEDKGIARSGMKVYSDSEEIGYVTSGSYLPTLAQSGGFAMVEISHSTPDSSLHIDVRGKRKLARTVKRPLYSAKVK